VAFTGAAFAGVALIGAAFALGLLAPFAGVTDLATGLAGADFFGSLELIVSSEN